MVFRHVSQMHVLYCDVISQAVKPRCKLLARWEDTTQITVYVQKGHTAGGLYPLLCTDTF